MEVKKVSVKKFDSGNLRGFATVNLGDNTDTLCIDGLKVMEKKSGGEFFVGFPSTTFKDKDGKTAYKDVCFPINASLREHIQQAVLKQYNKEGGSKDNKDDPDSLPF